MKDGDEGLALPRDLNAKLFGYGEPIQHEAEPFPSLKDADPKAAGTIHRTIIRREPRFRETIKGKLVGVAVGLSIGGCAAVPVTHFMSKPSAVSASAEANGVAPDSPEARDLAQLQEAFDKVQAGEMRGTVVLDLGHGDFKKQNKDGTIATAQDPGAVFEVPGGRDIHESEIVEAMGARLALQLIRRGYNVKFTRHIDLANNPHLRHFDPQTKAEIMELRPTERAIIDRINSPVTVLANRFDARIETARQEAMTSEKPTAYLVVHADKSPNKDRRGVALSISPHTPANSASYRLSKSLQDSYRHAQAGSLIYNAEKGIIPGQKGFGALFKDDCTPEIGLGTRDVWIIAPKPVGDGFSQVRHGLGDIPYSLLELGNLSNASDRWRLRDQKWATNLARTTADGIDAFFAHEYEGVKAPPKPSTITVNGKQAQVVPSDPEAEKKLSYDMANAIPDDKAMTTSIRTRVVQRCEPSGDKYNVRIAEYVPIKPKPDPHAAPAVAASKPTPNVQAPAKPVPAKTHVAKVESARPAIPKPAKPRTPETARKPSDHATRDSAPRTRS